MLICFRLAVLLLVCLAIIAASSLILNLTLICLRYRCRCTVRQPSSPQAKHVYKSFRSSSEFSPPESSSSETEEEKELEITNEDMDIKLKEFQYKISKDELNRKNSYTMKNTSNLWPRFTLLCRVLMFRGLKRPVFFQDLAASMYFYMGLYGAISLGVLPGKLGLLYVGIC